MEFESGKNHHKNAKLKNCKIQTINNIELLRLLRSSVNIKIIKTLGINKNINLNILNNLLFLRFTIKIICFVLLLKIIAFILPFFTLPTICICKPTQELISYKGTPNPNHCKAKMYS